MDEYALVMLNVLEYACIYLNNQSPEYARILNLSDAVPSMRSLYKLFRSFVDRCIQNNIKLLIKMERFVERKIPECRNAARNISGQGRFRGTRAL